MPQGIFLLIHDEITGPEIKCSYFKIAINLPPDLITKLYMSHTGFNSASLLEIEFGNQYRIVSYFTGHKERKSQEEGILGLILEENEKSDNLELFLRRNLDYILMNLNNQTIEEIFKTKLPKYLELNNLFDKVSIENVPEILIINGGIEYKSTLLRIGEKKLTNLELAFIYKRIMHNEVISHFNYCRLNIEDSNIFLLMKVEKSMPHIDRIMAVMESYIENYFYYALEVLALFLLAPMIIPVSLKPKLYKDFFDRERSILRHLQKAEDYDAEFNKLISLICTENIYLSAIPTF